MRGTNAVVIESMQIGQWEIERKIDDWWHQFACKANDLDDLFSHRSEWDLPAWMERHLQAISPDLMWEFGRAVRGDGHRLVITPEAEKHLRPMVQTLLERAPSLSGWEFYAHRLPEDLEMAHQMVTVRAGGDLSGTLATAMIGQHNCATIRARPATAMTSKPCTMPLSRRKHFSARNSWINGSAQSPLTVSANLKALRSYCTAVDSPSAA
jgi:hypothetical protein